ncbi:MAG: hypothetical protein R2748_12080 [Bryobacterales bacterium]
MARFPEHKSRVPALRQIGSEDSPLMAGMMIPNNAKDNPVYEKAVVEQQRVRFERSLE